VAKTDFPAPERPSMSVTDALPEDSIETPRQ